MKKLWKRFLWLVGLNLVDAVNTTMYTHIFGADGEGNPIMRFFYKFYGVNSFFVVKTAVLLFLGTALVFMPRNAITIKKAQFNLAIINVVYTLVVAWGFFCLYWTVWNMG